LLVEHHTNTTQKNGHIPPLGSKGTGSRIEALGIQSFKPKRSFQRWTTKPDRGATRSMVVGIPWGSKAHHWFWSQPPVGDRWGLPEHRLRRWGQHSQRSRRE